MSICSENERITQNWIVPMAENHKNQHFLDRRQRRIDRRRAEILTAAARTFAEKGYANTTTREVAEAADVAEGTLYNYFANKREILLAIAQETEAPMETAVMATEHIRDRESVVALVERALDLQEAQVRFWRSLLAEAWVDDAILQQFVAIRLARTHRRLTAFITERVADGSLRAVDPGLTAQLIIGMFVALIAPEVRGIKEPSTPQERRALAEAIVDLLLDGILARS
jgi:AcrR family transcriptional regulator